MGLKTVDWSRVVDLVGAKTGVDFRDKELVRASALINSAAQYIFDESRYHPRFLVLEPRTQSRGYIQPTEDSYNVYGAGTRRGLMGCMFAMVIALTEGQHIRCMIQTELRHCITFGGYNRCLMAHH